MRIVLALLLLLNGVFGAYNCNANTNRAVFYVTTNTNESTISFFKNLKNETDKKNVSLKLININSDYLNRQSDALYIAAGNRSFEYLLKEKISAPVLAIFISRLSFQQLRDTYSKDLTKSKISAIFSDPSPIQQLYLTKSLFSNTKKTTVLISKRTEFLIPDLKAAAEITGIPLYISEHRENQNINKTLHNLQSAEVILALPDSSIYNNRKTVDRIIFAAYRRNQSIIGFSREFVDAGGLATVYSDSKHIQSETLDAVKKYLVDGSLKSPTYPKLFDIEINEDVVDSYNLILPEKSALRKHIKQSLEACCEK